MPQDLDLDIPFPPRISPDVAGARQRNIDRLVREGLLTREENVARYLSWDVAQLAGRFHPEAVGEDLDLGLLQQTFYFVFDDLFDTCLGEEPDHAYRLAHRMVSLVRRDGTGRPQRPAFPLGEMFVEVWSRSRKGMSDSWCRRAALNWEQFFLSYVTEAVTRASRTVLDIDTYIRQRQIAIGSRGVLDMVECLARVEAPPEMHESSCFLQMRDITAEVVTLANDVTSLEKDEANREVNNAVLLLCLQRRISRQEAVDTVRDMIRTRLAHFQVLSAEALRLCGVLGLSSRERGAVERFVDGNRAVVRGNHDWTQSNGRYSRQGVEQVQKSACLEDRITETPLGPHPHRAALTTDPFGPGTAATRPTLGALLSASALDPRLRALLTRAGRDGTRVRSTLFSAPAPEPDRVLAEAEARPATSRSRQRA
ncbi:terpene synthase family protein [Streptomyces blastmyceticus]|uniref:Terpene synthase n=1 Tax=Streptomyces blastmyceticus TaxID=68180 RepID=A0ABP3HUP7_9ACTN